MAGLHPLICDLPAGDFFQHNPRVVESINRELGMCSGLFRFTQKLTLREICDKFRVQESDEKNPRQREQFLINACNFVLPPIINPETLLDAFFSAEIMGSDFGFLIRSEPLLSLFSRKLRKIAGLRSMEDMDNYIKLVASNFHDCWPASVEAILNLPGHEPGRKDSDRLAALLRRIGFLGKSIQWVLDKFVHMSPPEIGDNLTSFFTTFNNIVICETILTGRGTSKNLRPFRVTASVLQPDKRLLSQYFPVGSGSDKNISGFLRGALFAIFRPGGKTEAVYNEAMEICNGLVAGCRLYSTVLGYYFCKAGAGMDLQKFPARVSSLLLQEGLARRIRVQGYQATPFLLKPGCSEETLAQVMLDCGASPVAVAEFLLACQQEKRLQAEIPPGEILPMTLSAFAAISEPAFLWLGAVLDSEVGAWRLSSGSGADPTSSAVFLRGKSRWSFQTLLERAKIIAPSFEAKLLTLLGELVSLAGGASEIPMKRLLAGTRVDRLLPRQETVDEALARIGLNEPGKSKTKKKRVAAAKVKAAPPEKAPDRLGPKPAAAPVEKAPTRVPAAALAKAPAKPAAAELPESELCQICMASRRSHIILPCGHYLFCLPCLSREKHCPICRREISSICQVYG